MLVGFYGALFSFLFILLACIGTAIIYARKRDDTKYGAWLALGVLALFSLIIVSVYSYDLYQYKFTEGRQVAGQCNLEFIRGGRSIDITEVTVNEQIYVVKSSRFKDVKDGLYECEFSYMPLTKTVYTLEFR